MKKLGSIRAEAAACRKAFEGVKVGALAWCVHHEIEIEPLTEPPEARIAYILKEKPREERARRLREFRPVLGDVPRAVAKARAAYYKARAAYYKARAAYYKARADYYEASADYYEASAAYYKARAAYYKARAAYYKARAAYSKARAAYSKAYTAYDKALRDNPVLAVQHKREYPDTAWNGRSIFGGAA